MRGLLLAQWDAVREWRVSAALAAAWHFVMAAAGRAFTAAAGRAFMAAAGRALAARFGMTAERSDGAATLNVEPSLPHGAYNRCAYNSDMQ